MNRNDILAKIAEAKYLQRMRIEQEFDIKGGDAETDWLWAERAVSWFEADRTGDMADEYKREEFSWVFPLYERLNNA